VYGEHLQQHTATRRRGVRTATSATVVHAIRLSRGRVRPATVLPLRRGVDCCARRLQAGCMEWRTKCAAERDAVASRTAFSEAAAAHVSIAKWACGCERVLLRAGRRCAREANWTETRQQGLRWGVLLSRGSFRWDMIPVLRCALERVILQHRLRARTIADTHTQQQ
jgi:hypothetical protein